MRRPMPPPTPTPCAGNCARPSPPTTGVAPGQVLCGGGAAELIFRLAFALHPRRALVTAPTFSEYEGALSAAGVCRHPPPPAAGAEL